MKKKNSKLKKAAAKSRIIDRRIAAAKSPDVRRYLAMYDQETPPSEIQILVGEWALVNAVRDNPKLAEIELEIWKKSSLASDPKSEPPTNERFKRALQKAADFIRVAMLKWDADALIELAKEMKREAKRDKSYNTDRRRRVLLACGLSPKDAAEVMLADGNIKLNWLKKRDNEKRQLQRIKNIYWQRSDK